MNNYIEADLLERVLNKYYHIEVLSSDWLETLKRALDAPKFPRREKEFKHQLAYAILNKTISSSHYEKLTDLELETYEEVVQELKELWVDLYGDEPISLETL